MTIDKQSELLTFVYTYSTQLSNFSLVNGESARLISFPQPEKSILEASKLKLRIESKIEVLPHQEVDCIPGWVGWLFSGF